MARALSKLGYCSRARGFELIRAGRVRLNGAVSRNPETAVKLDGDRIEVDGQPLRPRQKIYLALNKPRGVLTTASDEKGRQSVYSLLPHELGWVGPVGRLDKASEGLLLLTNDSEWAARITDPATHLDKIYHVQIRGVAADSTLRALTTGVRTNPGDLLRAKNARLLRAGKQNCWLEIVLDEGKNRQIRRMLEVLGFEVLRLLRISIGPLVLGELAKGKWRNLSAQEKQDVDDAIAGARTAWDRQLLTTPVGPQRPAHGRRESPGARRQPRP